MINTYMHGVSPTARYVAETQAKHSHYMHRSSAIGMEKVQGELGEVWIECRKENWDGYQALPVTYDALQNAIKFLNSFPLGYQHPSVGALPDGYLTLEWHRTPQRTLSVSISPDGDLHYAALLGPSRTCGTEPFFGEVPQTILDLIRRVYSSC